MEKMLIKMARQLNAFDEASLTALWDKYADSVSVFEPTKRWEEGALILGFIQALRWKNQLFNHHWSQSSQTTAPEEGTPWQSLMEEVPNLLEGSDKEESEPKRPGSGRNSGKRAKVLRFRPREGDEPV